MFKNLIRWIQEKRGLRRCDTLAEWKEYAKVLKTPERIAYWIANTIYYEVEPIPTWFPLEQALKNKRGNCTEMAGLAVIAMRELGYQAECLNVFGNDQNYTKVSHAVCAFNDGVNRGVIEGGKVIRYKNFAPWPLVAIELRPEWKAIRWQWLTINGKKLPRVDL